MIQHRESPNGKYGTLIAPLVTVALQTADYNFYEFGMGDFSTPVLHEIVTHQCLSGKSNRRLISFENDSEWLSNFEDLERPWHHIKLLESWDDATISEHAVVLIDHGPAERRVIDIERFAQKASMIIVHDVEKIQYYGYEPVLSSFKYRNDYLRYKKRTTVVSNHINLKNLMQ